MGVVDPGYSSGWSPALQLGDALYLCAIIETYISSAHLCLHIRDPLGDPHAPARRKVKSGSTMCMNVG
jgi:hypothetical protein